MSGNNFPVIDNASAVAVACRRQHWLLTIAMAAPNDTKRNDAPAQPEKKDTPQEQSNVPTLGALDEDDEFEEFETEGMWRRCWRARHVLTRLRVA